MPVLDYDAERREFHFTRPAGGIPFPGTSISTDEGGRRFSFEDVSPKNYYNIKTFKAWYKDDAKASPAASARIRELAEERETDYASKYAHLITGHPYEHQLATINLMQKNDRYALLLEQGLGKTYIALQSFKIFKERDGYLRAVVVCPKVVVPTWIHEIEKFAPELRVLVYRGTVEERREAWTASPDFEVMITTYEMIRKEGGLPLAEKAYNAWAWQKMTMANKTKLVDVMADRLGDKRDLLLADPSSMSKKERAKWRAKIGGKLAWAGETYWSERSFAYMDYEGISEERLAMQRLVGDEQDHDFVTYLINDQVKPSVVVFDEASRLINHRAKQAEAAEEIRAKRKYLMSGTLCVGRPTDMYMPMKVLDRGILDMNWTAFRDKFCVMSRYNRNIITGYKNLDKLKAKVDPYIVEYRRDDCLDLPDRTIVTCYYEPDQKVVELYDSVVTSDRIEVDGKTVNCPLQLQKIQKCMQLLSGFVHTADDYKGCACCPEERIVWCATHGFAPWNAGCERRGEADPRRDFGTAVEIVPDRNNAKLQMLEEDLGNIASGEKIIIWYWYKYDFDRIKALLENMRIEYTTAEDDDCAARFEANPDIRVFVGQVVQGIGITLNSATTTIYYSHGLALEPRLQSMDRNLRIGQSKPVVVRDYVCRGSVEEAVVSLLQHKEDVRDFMQKRIECLTCDNLLGCLERNVTRLKEGCVFHDDMKKAEEKRTLKLGILGGTYGR